MANKKATNRTLQTRPEKRASKELTDKEKARLGTYHQRSQRQSVKFKSIGNDSDNPAITLENPDDPLVMVKMLEALGTPDANLQQQLLNQVVQTFKGIASTDGADYDKIVPAVNNAMAMLNGIEPKDEIEGMLAVQMIGVHNLAMDSLQRAMLDGQTFEGRKANMAYATKMLKTFSIQVETLKKYRTNSQIKMIVGSVSVSDGGQAIVGTVNQSAEKKT